MKIAELRNQVTNLPERPGVYVFRDDQNRILYIGKSVNIRKRVVSHLYAPERSHPRLKRLYRSAESVEWIETGSEILALLLEDHSIKNEQPIYNKRQKSQKPYRYLTLTSEIYPRLKIIDEHQRRSANGWYGPFYDHFKAQQMVELLHLLVPLRTCTESEPVRQCLNGQIARCLGPCSGLSADDYQQQVDRIRSWLSGSEDPAPALEKAISACVNAKEFRQALFIHERKGMLVEFQNRQAFISRFLAGPAVLVCLQSGCKIVFNKGQISHLESNSDERIDPNLFKNQTRLHLYDRGIIVYTWLKKAGDRARFDFS